ncbi:MAG: drug/metabolite transporter (DMT)-like permease [Planctomycetota bacterium]|jgi:drug/metabolite transporter (DMT)-like permease
MKKLSVLRGIACMLMAGFFLASNDAVTKWLVPLYPVGEILFFQAIVISFLVAGLMRFRGEALLAFNHWGLHLCRGLLYVVGSFSFVFALKFLPLAEVVAIAFAGPLFMTLLARFMLKEVVGWHRIAAVVTGFVGVIIIIRPGGSAMHWAVLLPLIVALSDAFRDVITRKMTAAESSTRIVLSTAVILALAAGSTSVGGWPSVAQSDYVWFLLSGICFVAGHFFLIEAFRNAPVTVVAPFKYAQLIWSILAGLIFWNELPDGIVFVGIAVIACSGVYIAWREAKLSRAQRRLVEEL